VGLCGALGDEAVARLLEHSGIGIDAHAHDLAPAQAQHIHPFVRRPHAIGTRVGFCPFHSGQGAPGWTFDVDMLKIEVDIGQ